MNDYYTFYWLGFLLFFARKVVLQNELFKDIYPEFKGKKVVNTLLLKINDKYAFYYYLNPIFIISPPEINKSDSLFKRKLKQNNLCIYSLIFITLLTFFIQKLKN